MKTVIINGKIITPSTILEGYNLLIEDEKIIDISKDALTADITFDAEGSYVSPGFIDMHTHGAGGHDFMDGTLESILGASEVYIKSGATSVCPTSLACSNDELFNFFDIYEKAKNSPDCKTNFLGIHLEGPYFSPLQAGAQDPKYLKNPKRSDYEKILLKHKNISRISLAPELDGAMDLARELRDLNIIASVAHSDATYDTILEAFDNGFTHITHLYSGMSTIKRINAYRHLGVVESAYLIDDMTVEIIADGKHLPPELLKLILKCKPLDKISLITDSMRGAGMPEGSEVLLGSKEKGQPCVIDNGVAFLPDFSSFAGSVCTADRCIKTMYKDVGCTLQDAVAMMTRNPAKVLKLQNKKGTIAVGMDADICIFDDDISIHSVLVMGKKVF